jgi:hypothetical protein
MRWGVLRVRFRKDGAMAAVELRFDPALVEEAVFLEFSRPAASGAAQIVAAFHREREAVYGLADAGQRDAAFQQLALRYFQSLGLAELFTARLEEFPRLSDRIELAVVRRVWSRKDEQVELYVGRPPEARLPVEASTTLFIGLQVSRCLDRGKLVAFLRHELMHVVDMLDPAFAYDPHVGFGGEYLPENELIRERFRLLWDLWVHGRMKRLGWQTVTADAGRRQEFERMFEFLDPTHRKELFKTVSEQDRWTQGELLALARQPQVAAAA